jgi:opacity protein-like surface antigen
MTCLNLRQLGCGAVFAALASLASPASAADLGGDVSMKDMGGEPEMARPMWDGFYLGIHAGYGWGGFNPSDVDPFFAALIEEDLEHDPDGGLLGVQAGYNFQRGRWVFGIEGDNAASNVEGDLFYDYVISPDTITDTQTMELDYLATLRGRIGVDMGSMLLYFTGGLAWAKVDSEFTVTVTGAGGFPDGTISGSDNVTHAGYAIGGGVETWIAENVSFKAEYLYLDLGEETHTPVAGVPGEPFDLDMHTVRVGLNYHF